MSSSPSSPATRCGTIGRRNPGQASDGHHLVVGDRSFQLPDDAERWGSFASRFGPFDRLVLEGSLGDLVRPDLGLHGLLELLAPGGHLVVGNRVISHADDRVQLLRGAWPPPWSTGELRFFTRTSLESLLVECELEIVDVEVEHAPIRSPEVARLLAQDQHDTVRAVMVTTRRARRGAIPPPHTFDALAAHAGRRDSATDSGSELELGSLRGRRRVLAVQPMGALTESLVEAGHVVTVLDRQVPSPSRFAADEVVTADLDVDPLPTTLLERFDAVVSCDVLPVVADPVRHLRTVGRCLAPGGIAVVSVPNGLHVDVRLELAAGRWPVRDGGPLDRAAVRLLTTESLQAHVDAAGFEVLGRHTTCSRRTSGEGGWGPITDMCRSLLEHDESADVRAMTWVLKPEVGVSAPADPA